MVTRCPSRGVVEMRAGVPRVARGWRSLGQTVLDRAPSDELLDNVGNTGSHLDNATRETSRDHERRAGRPGAGARCRPVRCQKQTEVLLDHRDLPARSRQLHCSEKTSKAPSNDGNVHPVIVHHRQHPVDHPLQLHPEARALARAGRRMCCRRRRPCSDVGKHSNHVPDFGASGEARQRPTDLDGPVLLLPAPDWSPCVGRDVALGLRCSECWPQRASCRAQT